MKKKIYLTGLIFLSLAVFTCKSPVLISKGTQIVNPDINLNPTSDYLSPKESLKTMHLPEGYHLQLVASEPMIEEPVAIAWDANGRMFVAEMRSYMKDVNGSNEKQPIGRVSLLEDTNGDGVMDKHTIFIDSLVLPRMILSIDNSLIVNETDSQNYYSYKDTNGDGKADVKTLIYNDDSIDKRNLEHQKSGLIWNIDNNIYVTDPHRFRYTNGKFAITKYSEARWPFGQWGLANDNYGRLFFSSAGGEIPAMGFQQNPVYGALDFKDQYGDVFQATWPITSTPDVQGGLVRLRKDSTLNHFTSSNGQSIFRGDKLPADMVSDLFICEPVGRLVRRAKVINDEGKIELKNAYNHAEFIASTDMNFRPVNTVTGPDGCLYVVDMYHGIIQESTWTAKGSYLRPVILRKGLDKNIGRGRIYRVIHDGYTPNKAPKFLDEPSSKLVEYLAHPNGWWRDNAQKLIVVRGDHSVVPALKEMALKNSSPLGRLHALWTLEGLSVIDPEILYAAYKDQDAQVRKAAVCISEDLLKSNNKITIEKLEALKNDPDPNVRFQLALSLRYSKTYKAKAILKEMVTRYANNEVIADAAKRSLNTIDPPKPVLAVESNMSPADKKLVADGAVIFRTLCATCHGAEGKGLGIGGSSMVAPFLSGSKRVNGNKEVVIRILLNGLSGPIEGKNFPDVMPSMRTNDDKWIASVLSYVRNNFSNKAPVIHPEDVTKIRKETEKRDKFWTLAELDKYKTN